MEDDDEEDEDEEEDAPSTLPRAVGGGTIIRPESVICAVIGSFVSPDRDEVMEESRPIPPTVSNTFA